MYDDRKKLKNRKRKQLTKKNRVNQLCVVVVLLYYVPSSNRRRRKKIPNKKETVSVFLFLSAFIFENCQQIKRQRNNRMLSADDDAYT